MHCYICLGKGMAGIVVCLGKGMACIVISIWVKERHALLYLFG